MANLEVTFRPNPNMTIKAECRDIEEIFKVVGPLQEVLGNGTCGKCKKNNIRVSHRKADGKYDVYELVCGDCGAKLALGKNTEDGTLFPRRYEQDPDDPKKPLLRDGKKVWLPDNGWIKWDSKLGKYV